MASINTRSQFLLEPPISYGTVSIPLHRGHDTAQHPPYLRRSGGLELLHIQSLYISIYIYIPSLPVVFPAHVPLLCTINRPTNIHQRRKIKNLLLHRFLNQAKQAPKWPPYRKTRRHPTAPIFLRWRPRTRRYEHLRLPLWFGLVWFGLLLLGLCID